MILVVDAMKYTEYIETETNSHGEYQIRWKVKSVKDQGYVNV